MIDEYETTVYAEEALYRLVEIHYLLGLKDEAKKYANVLGYNYQSSTWYEKSYSFFDKQYQIRKKIKKDNKKTINKFKSLFKLDE